MSIIIVKDLRTCFSGARDQGQRPTCMVFAASDAHAQARTGVFNALSTEYLYYHAAHQTSPVSYGGAVSLASVSAVIAAPGQPLETECPYMPALPPNPSDWLFPGPVTNYRATISHEPAQLASISEALDHNTACIVTMNITRSFYIPDSDGIISVAQREPVTGSHAVVAVGYGMSRNGRTFLVRNSWGVDWGLSGYAWLNESYLLTHLRTVSVITTVF